MSDIEVLLIESHFVDRQQIAAFSPIFQTKDGSYYFLIILKSGFGITVLPNLITIIVSKYNSYYEQWTKEKLDLQISTFLPSN